jgi:hypothetical protein
LRSRWPENAGRRLSETEVSFFSNHSQQGGGNVGNRPSQRAGFYGWEGGDFRRFHRRLVSGFPFVSHGRLVVLQIVRRPSKCTAN